MHYLIANITQTTFLIIIYIFFCLSSSIIREPDIVKVENENFCIGKLSDEDSKSMLPFLKVGWDNLFYAKICLKNCVDSEDKRIKIVIYIASKKE